MKKYTVLIIFILLIVNLYAQSMETVNPEEYSWRMLQKAQTAYDQRDFGISFKYAQTAKVNRKKESDWALATLELAMKPVAVQKIGDDIDEVLAILKERDSHDAVLIIENILANLPKDYFNYSIENIKNYIKKFTEYPEADFLLGKIYGLEGEYTLSQSFLLKAWEHSDLLSIPEEKYDILYEIASLSLMTGNMEKYEKSLLLITADDPNYIQNTNETGFSKSLVRAIKTGTSLDKFFLLYRNSSYNSMKAFFYLADYYNSQIHNTGDSDALMQNTSQDNRILLHDKVLTMSSMGVVSAVTRIEDVLKTRKLDYSYSSLEALLKDISEYEDIVTWGKKYDVWKGFYIFSLSVYDSGQTDFAEKLLSVLSQYCPDVYWSRASKEKLVSIQSTQKVLVH